MGNKTITTVHTNYIEDPKVLQRLKLLQDECEKQQKQLEKLTNPQYIEAREQMIFDNFVKNLATFDVHNKLPTHGGNRYVAVIGENSAGKSSIYNWLFGLKLAVGVDDTTQEIAIVHSDLYRKLKYYDSPGLNEYQSITNAELLKAFYQIHYVFIATAITFKNCKRCIQVMNKINPPKLVLVRTQCDKFPSQQEFQNAKKKDHDLLKSWGISREVLYISSKRSDFFKDNARFRQLMAGEN